MQQTIKTVNIFIISWALVYLRKGFIEWTFFESSTTKYFDFIERVLNVQSNDDEKLLLQINDSIWVSLTIWCIFHVNGVFGSFCCVAFVYLSKNNAKSMLMPVFRWWCVVFCWKFRPFNPNSTEYLVA